MESPDFVGLAGVPGQGRYLVLYVRMDGTHVADARFDCHGCGVTIACGSALTELITGRQIRECAGVTTQDLVDALDGVPADRADCPEFAMHALRHLVSQAGPACRAGLQPENVAPSQTEPTGARR